jgi:ABC-type uncharacterized transport system permease subunit
VEILIGLIQTSFLAGGVLVFAALGEMLTERVGVVNLGVEGVVSLGAMAAIVAVLSTGSAVLGFGVAIGVGVVAGMIFALATVIIRANQVLCGLALTLLGTGIAATLGRHWSGVPAPATFTSISIPILSDLPLVGRALFQQNILVYVAFVILPLFLHWLMFRTRHGLNMRALGENPEAADAVGIPVTVWRFFYVAAGTGLSGAAGGYLTLAFVPSWTEGAVAGRGWIAVALVIFAGFRPINVAIASFFFGLVTAVGFVGQALNWPIAAAILSMLPYFGTLTLMILPVAIFKRMRRIMAAPASVGLPFHRELR